MGPRVMPEDDSQRKPREDIPLSFPGLTGESMTPKKRAAPWSCRVKSLDPHADQTTANQECSMRTYSKSTGWLLMPTRGGAIQLAYSPGWWQAFMSELMKS